MKLRLVARRYFPDCTISDLLIDGEFFCSVLEDTYREVEGDPVKTWKVAGDTAIPAGEYGVVVTYSPRFQRDLPLLEDVEHFTGVRIHAGNNAADTEGCLLVGHWDGSHHGITKSRAALEALMEAIEGHITSIIIERGIPHGERTSGEDQSDDPQKGHGAS